MVNEETILLIGSIIVFTYIGKVCVTTSIYTLHVAFTFNLQIAREPYSQWAEGHIQRIKKVLDGARAEHTQAVQERIDSVGQMKDVVSLTKSLFELSKVWYI